MNAETREFINLYNQLESLIRSSYDLPKDAGPIYWLSHSLSSFRDVSTDLDYIRRVRNLLSHCGLVNDDYPVTHARHHANLRIVSDYGTAQKPKFNI